VKRSKQLSLINVLMILVLFLAASATSSASPIQLGPNTTTPNQESSDQETGAMFIENMGQFAEEARFQVRGADNRLWLTENAVWLTLRNQPEPNEVHPPSPGRGVHLRLSFAGSNAHPHIEPFDRLSTRVSYFIGNDPTEWYADVPVWGGVRYHDLYPGLDMEITSKGGQWTWSLVCERSNCEAALQMARLRVEGADGVTVETLQGERESISGGATHLRLFTSAGSFTLPLLQAKGIDVTSLDLTNIQPTVEGSEIQKPVALYSQYHADPITSLDSSNLLYSTFLGDDEDDFGSDIAIDSAGNSFVTGMADSWDFPTTPGAFDPSHPILTEAFVAKLDPSGTTLVYATMLGGGNDEQGRAITVDDAGNAYVTGDTASDNFPTTPEAFDPSYQGGYYPFDAFVFKLNPEGTEPVFGTYLGGGADDRGQGIAVDGAGNVYVAGGTTSGNFPTTSGAFQPNYHPPSPQGELDAFVAKLSADGSTLVYGTYLGTGTDDSASGIAVDGAGNAYVIGDTGSAGFPTTPEAYDTGYNGNRDVFVVKLNGAGSALDYGTFLGGGQTDSAAAIVVDGTGAAYVMGDTRSADFPVTTGAYDTTFGGGTCGSGPCHDVFVARLHATGSALTFATFLGGSESDYAGDVAVDTAGGIYVTGSTNSSDFPATPCAFDVDANDINWGDGFVAKLSAAGSRLSYATFLGGAHQDSIAGIAVAEPNFVYATGKTRSEDLPTTQGAFDTSFGGGSCVLGAYPCRDAFVTKLETLPRCTVSGRVLNSAGKPLADVQIAANDTYSGTTDANGVYTITGVLSGTHTFAPATLGYFWSPSSRVVTVPPDAAEQDFAAHRINKRMTPAAPSVVALGERITYTIHVITPTSGMIAFYDQVPTHTTFVSDSFIAPAGVVYQSSIRAITGTLDLTAAVSQTVSFAVSVTVAGTASFAPLIRNEACIYGLDLGIEDCEWSKEVWVFTYARTIHLPLVMRSG
jgi:uncharacterized repeat protein (TIGR01451 family)